MNMCTSVTVAEIEEEMYYNGFKHYCCFENLLPGKALFHFVRYNLMKGQLDTYESDKSGQEKKRGGVPDIAKAAYGLFIIETLSVNFNLAAILYRQSQSDTIKDLSTQRDYLVRYTIFFIALMSTYMIKLGSMILMTLDMGDFEK